MIKKDNWRRIAVVILLGALSLVLLCGCFGANPKQTETTEPTVLRESELLDTAEKVMTFVEEMAQIGAEKFSLVCSKEIFDALVKVTYREDGL